MKHNNQIKRLLSVLLCLMMIFSLFPVSVFAEGVEETEQGESAAVTLNIDFVSEDGAALAEACSVSAAKGAAFERTVPFASVEGYRPAKVEFGAVNAANALGEEGVISVYGECANVQVTREGLTLTGAAEADVSVIVTYAALAVAEQPDDEQLTGPAMAPAKVGGQDLAPLDDYGIEPLAGGKYKLYYYALVPGEFTGSGTPDKSWFGLGVAWIEGVEDPAVAKDHSITNYTINTENPDKELFPDLEFNGKIYKYAPTGSDNANKENYYTLEPTNVTIANGANGGKNNYNTTVPNGTWTYHYDHVVTLNDKDVFAVNFMVKEPAADKFIPMLSSSRRVPSGTQENRAWCPDMADDAQDGLTYKFDGWYEDENCTEKATFGGEITVNKNYYGKYVPTQQRYAVEYYYDSVKDDNKTEISVPQTIGSKINEYTAKPVAGYRLDKCEGLPLTVSTEASQNVIKVFYAKQGYSVTYELTAGSATTVDIPTDYNLTGKHVDDVIEVAADLSKAGYTFSGWKSDDVTIENGKFTMPAGDVVLTGSFSIDDNQRKDLAATVDYALDGVVQAAARENLTANVQILQPDTLSTAAVAEKTFAGWRFDTITVDGEAVEALPATVNNGAVVVYNYTQRTDLTYTVNYLNADTGAALRAPATVTGQTFGSTVTVNPVAIAGYTTPAAQTLTIAVTGNVVNFYYAAIPVIPGNPVVDIPPIPQLPATIDDERTPLDGPQVTVDDPETIDDEATPLAAGAHNSCILHFLILCAALLIELLYVSSMKQRQQKVFEIRRELKK